MTTHIYIVAEIGCNHNGSKELAKEMVLKAKECDIYCNSEIVFHGCGPIFQAESG